MEEATRKLSQVERELLQREKGTVLRPCSACCRRCTRGASAPGGHALASRKAPGSPAGEWDKDVDRNTSLVRWLNDSLRQGAGWGGRCECRGRAGEGVRCVS